jgi:hypothetical protein
MEEFNSIWPAMEQVSNGDDNIIFYDFIDRLRFHDREKGLKVHLAELLTQAHKFAKSQDGHFIEC